MRSVSNSGSGIDAGGGHSLETELGLSGEETLPDFDDLLLRLKQVRSEWMWKEVDPSELGGDLQLSELAEPGIYNRAVVMIGGERPPSPSA